MMKKNIHFLTVLYITIALFACSKGKLDPIDFQTGLRKNDFENILVKDPRKPQRDSSIDSGAGSEIPKMSKLTVSPPPVSSASNKTISFSVTDQVPLKDVIIEFGRVAKIDVEVDPTISGGIILNVKNRPVSEVVERIAELGGLRYRYEKGILHFEKDAPHVKNYVIDYLPETSDIWSDIESGVKIVLTDDATIAAANASVTSNIVVNKSAGLMYVFATTAQHQIIKKYLDEVSRNASAQVLIEAKLVEVKLNNTYKTGINWSKINENHLGGTNTFKVNGGYTADQPLDIITGVFGTAINASISALEEFGTVRTLASPRIHAINNQKASLNFADKFVYFKVDSSQSNTSTTGTSNTTTKTVTSTKLEENLGVLLNITPSINPRTGEITLNINPKITVKTGTVVDPASPTDDDGKVIIQNIVPIVQTRELTTIAKIQSGNVLVIGGLMREDASNTDNGVPFLQRIPILGYLFKSVSKTSNIAETVIFIKATIVNSNTRAGKEDREIQEKFDTNKRKFF